MGNLSTLPVTFAPVVGEVEVGDAYIATADGGVVVALGRRTGPSLQAMDALGLAVMSSVGSIMLGEELEVYYGPGAVLVGIDAAPGGAARRVNEPFPYPRADVQQRMCRCELGVPGEEWMMDCETQQWVDAARRWIWIQIVGPEGSDCGAGESGAGTLHAVAANVWVAEESNSFRGIVIDCGAPGALC